MTLTTIAPQITDSGVTAPTYYEALDYLKEQYKSIYGEDAYLENDSQDGQWIGVIARVVTECGAACVNVYSTFSPKTASKDALSRNVAINGIQRATATHSTVDLIISGSSGTIITNGYAVDVNSNQWMLPDIVNIPTSGLITVTATSAVIGEVLAMPNSITSIGKPTRGWSSVNNESASNLGMPIEEDSILRQRQALSVAIPSQSKTDSLKGALFSLPGVSRCKTYENDSDAVDSNGIASHSLCVVISGGNANEIAQTMRAKKSLGCGWFGNTEVTVSDSFGDPVNVKYYRPIIRNVGFYINAQSKVGYTADIADDIKQAIADYVNQLDIGDNITLNKIYIPAGLFGNLDSRTYEILSLQIIIDDLAIESDYQLKFNEVAYCSPENIEINISGGG